MGVTGSVCQWLVSVCKRVQSSSALWWANLMLDECGCSIFFFSDCLWYSKWRDLATQKCSDWSHTINNGPTFTIVGFWREYCWFESCYRRMVPDFAVYSWPRPSFCASDTSLCWWLRKQKSNKTRRSTKSLIRTGKIARCDLRWDGCIPMFSRCSTDPEV